MNLATPLWHKPFVTHFRSINHSIIHFRSMTLFIIHFKNIKKPIFHLYQLKSFYYHLNHFHLTYFASIYCISSSITLTDVLINSLWFNLSYIELKSVYYIEMHKLCIPFHYSISITHTSTYSIIRVRIIY